jgi:hypothetical protein
MMGMWGGLYPPLSIPAQYASGLSVNPNQNTLERGIDISLDVGIDYLQDNLKEPMEHEINHWQ